MALTPKQERFIGEFLVDLNATQAAIRAGYSSRTAKSIASELLGKPEVLAALNVRRNAISEQLDITTEWVMRRLQQKATLTGPDGTHSGRVSALTTLAKALGMLKERLKVEGEVKAEVKTGSGWDFSILSHDELMIFRELLEKLSTPKAVPPAT
ncbi:terminase small subunit [Zavarzinella formosa]|uniref:terminase small subunit n=1 Tax=Zavarzinella formosa TaxID=360055 RepID=UPI000301BB3D|nr:terminase small subunit [Zavarzinella formosa]